MPRNQLIQIRKGTTAQWAAADAASTVDPDRLLAAGEPGQDTETKVLKVGDGATKWVDLPGYLNDDSAPTFAAPTDVTQFAPGKLSWHGTGPLFEWAAQTTGALFHIVPGASATGPYQIGGGMDNDGNKFIVASLKANNNIGIALNLETTSGAGTIGGIVQVFGPGKGMEFRHGGASAGHLLVLKASGTATGRMFSVRNAADQESMYVDEFGRLTLQSNSANPHAATWNFGSGPSQRMYTYMGLDVDGVTPLFHATYIDTLTSESRSRVRQSRAPAAKGAESLTTMIQYIRGKHVSFFGRDVDATTGGDLTIAIPNATTAPTAAPATGGFLFYGVAGVPTFINDAGHVTALKRGASIPTPSGGSVVDAEARAALTALLTHLRPGNMGVIGS